MYIYMKKVTCNLHASTHKGSADFAQRMSKDGAPIPGYLPRRGVNTSCICEPRPRGTSVSHPAGGPRDVTRVCRGVVVP